MMQSFNTVNDKRTKIWKGKWKSPALPLATFDNSKTVVKRRAYTWLESRESNEDSEDYLWASSACN